jgi:tetratricopeptide (TPR) repeat protein
MFFQRFILLFSIVCVVAAQDTFSQNADVCKSDAISKEWNRSYLESAELYKKAANLYEAKGAFDTLCFFKAGQNFVRAKHFNEAIPFFDRLSQLKDYHDIKLWLNYADALIGLRQYENAQAKLDEGLQINPEEIVTVYEKKARLAYQDGDPGDAVTFADKALSVEPANSDILKLKAFALEKKGDFGAAIGIYKDLLSKNPKQKDVVLRLGMAAFADTEARYNGELKRYKKLNNPSRVEYSNSRKKLNQISLGYNDAIKYLEQSLGDHPGQKAIIQRLYVSYKRLGNKEKETFYKGKLGQ